MNDLNVQLAIDTFFSCVRVWNAPMVAGSVENRAMSVFRRVLEQAQYASDKHDVENGCDDVENG